MWYEQIRAYIETEWMILQFKLSFWQFHFSIRKMRASLFLEKHIIKRPRWFWVVVLVNYRIYRKYDDEKYCEGVFERWDKYTDYLSRKALRNARLEMTAIAQELADAVDCSTADMLEYLGYYEYY